MGLAETAKLLASFEAKDGLTPAVGKMSKSLDKLDTHLDHSQTRAYRAGQQIGTGIKAGAVIAAAGIGFLISQVGFGLSTLSKLEDAQTQTDAAIKSTGAVAGVTAGQIRNLAEKYENLNATIDDKVIQSGENLLLTFTNVRKEAFEPALAAALDMNQAMGGGPEGLQKTVIQLGKALNDPAKGFTALKRVGVTFTDQQIKTIKALQKSGDLLGAQKIILQELGTEFGGSFAAKGKTATATVAGIGDAVEDLQTTVATGLFPVIQKMLPRIREALTSPALLKGVGDLGDGIAALFSDENIRTGSKLIGDVFNAAKDAAPVLASAAGTMANAIKTGVGLFRSLPPEIQALAVAGLAVNKLTGGLVTNIAGGLISAVISSFKGMMNVNAAVVNVNGAVGGLPGAIPGAAAGAAGIGTGAALGIIGAAGAVGIIGAVNSPLWHEADKARERAADADLTQAEAAAQRYYTASAADQAEMRKRLAFLPTVADFESGKMKLALANPGTPSNPANIAQDADEKRLMANRSAFTSNPTRNELRVKIRDLKELKPTKDTQRAIKSLQGRLDHRIEEGNRKAAAAAVIAKQVLTATKNVASVVSRLDLKAPDVNVNVTVPITQMINGRVTVANLSRYISTTGGMDLARGILP